MAAQVAQAVTKLSAKIARLTRSKRIELVAILGNKGAKQPRALAVVAGRCLRQLNEGLQLKPISPLVLK